jgi:protein gp37
VTAIEWTEEVWNPTTGCDQVSEGCGLPLPGAEGDPRGTCYALTLAARLKGMGSAKYQRDGNPATSGPGFGLTVHPAAVNLPLRWRTPRRVFVNSMSDLFHSEVPTPWLAEIFAVMAATPRHTYQILTKRHARTRSVLRDPAFHAAVFDRAAGKAGVRAARWPLPNVWLGVSVETQHWADIRVPALLDTPAAVRWVSAEPLLGPVDLSAWLRPVPGCPDAGPDGCCLHPEGGVHAPECHTGVTCPPHRALGRAGLGCGRWGVRRRRPADAPGLAARPAGGVHRGRGAVLLQAVGRPHSQGGRPRVGRPHLG